MESTSLTTKTACLRVTWGTFPPERPLSKPNRSNFEFQIRTHPRKDFSLFSVIRSSPSDKCRWQGMRHVTKWPRQLRSRGLRMRVRVSFTYLQFGWTGFWGCRMSRIGCTTPSSWTRIPAKSGTGGSGHHGWRTSGRKCLRTCLHVNSLAIVDGVSEESVDRQNFKKKQSVMHSNNKRNN